MKLGILKGYNDDYISYVKACEDLNVPFEIIDIFSNDWIKSIKYSNCIGFLARPTVSKQYLKDGYDERVYFIEKMMNLPVYPSFNELFIYENKNNMYYWLSINNISCVDTNIFFKKGDALKFINSSPFPLVFKSKIGSAGIGVQFINSKREAKKLIRKIFPYHDLFAIPLINSGYARIIRSKKVPFKRTSLRDDKQFGFIMFQKKLVNIKCEWRMIRIGNSYFGHQKLASKEGKHSGSDLVGWIEPPEELLELTKRICDLGNFRSMNIDIFETEHGKYYVNELQSLFGSYNNSQMYIDGKPGRFLYIDDKWVFEEGFFNQNASMNLRVLDFVKILEEKNEN